MYTNWTTSRGSKQNPKSQATSSWTNNEIFYLININNIVDWEMKSLSQPPPPPLPPPPLPPPNTTSLNNTTIEGTWRHH